MLAPGRLLSHPAVLMTIDWFSPAQCVGYVAFVLGVTAFLQKDDRRFKQYMATAVGLPSSAKWTM
jgi:hypothetical protein